MTYATSYELLTQAELAKADSVTIGLDAGEFRVPVSEALQEFHTIAPGEYFQVISINFE